MFLRIALFILMTAGIAGFGAVAWISMRPPPQPVATTVAVVSPVSVNVLAAAKTLRPGVLLKPDDLTTVAMAKSAIPEGARVELSATRAELLGAMVRRTVPASEVCCRSMSCEPVTVAFLRLCLAPACARRPLEWTQ